MAEKPILFNTEMVRAILDGRKTVMRRVVKFLDGRNPTWTGYIPDGAVLYGSNNIPAAKAPYRPGDILYVRETWVENPHPWDGAKYVYRASIHPADYDLYKWRPSIHMPREAARIWLRVTDVRVERVQTSFFEPICPIFAVQAEGIDIGDTCRECIENYGEPCCVDTVDEDGSDLYGGECGELDQSRGEFSDIWDSTIKPADRDRYGWAANPFCWVITFERISKDEAMQ